MSNWHWSIYRWATENAKWAARNQHHSEAIRTAGMCSGDVQSNMAGEYSPVPLPLPPQSSSSSYSVIDMFAIQFGYSAWDSGPWGYLLLAVQIAVGLVVWSLSARFKRE